MNNENQTQTQTPAPAQTGTQTETQPQTQISLFDPTVLFSATKENVSSRSAQLAAIRGEITKVFNDNDTFTVVMDMFTGKSKNGHQAFDQCMAVLLLQRESEEIRDSELPLYDIAKQMFSVLRGHGYVISRGRILGMQKEEVKKDEATNTGGETEAQDQQNQNASTEPSANQ